MCFLHDPRGYSPSEFVEEKKTLISILIGSSLSFSTILDARG